MERIPSSLLLPNGGYCHAIPPHPRRGRACSSRFFFLHRHSGRASYGPYAISRPFPPPVGTPLAGVLPSASRRTGACSRRLSIPLPTQKGPLHLRNGPFLIPSNSHRIHRPKCLSPNVKSVAYIFIFSLDRFCFWQQWHQQQHPAHQQRHHRQQRP